MVDLKDNFLKSWTFDKETMKATHKSGLTIKFKNYNSHAAFRGVFLQDLMGKIEGDLPESIDWRTYPSFLISLMNQAKKGMQELLNDEC